MVKVVLTFDGDSEEFKRELEKNDDEFDFFDSLYYQLDYEAKGNVGTHNGISITVEENDWEGETV